MTTEAGLREAICRWGRSMFERGLTSGSSGNLSARLDEGFLVTPTNACLGFLEPERLAKIDADGNHVNGDRPTKEVPLHLAFYRARPGAGSVVHLHSTFATALSCLEDVDSANVIAPTTPYVIMRVGRIPLIPFIPPGSNAVGPVEEAARDHAAMLLANHGPVVSGPSLEAAVFAAEEVEEAAKVQWVLTGRRTRLLADDVIAALDTWRR